MQIYSDKVFKNPIKVIKAFDSDSFVQSFKEIEALKTKYYLVGYVRYEAKDIFLGKYITSKMPLLYFEVFENFEKFELKQNSKDVFLFPKPDITFEEYKKGFDAIKDEIASGNTYEVNYTFDFNIDTEYRADEIYKYFLQIQKTPYNAFLSNDYETILSFSPELFFRKNGRHVLTKPMKGTISRGKTEIEDKNNIEFLQNDEKNRAENVMIVDLLRNDLGKISKVGSVNVSKLFEIETHKTLHQMTSEVESELRENISLYQLFEAIFPCGSITGAPKISTMKIIENVELGNRNVYCGAIGLIHGDFCEFSVPIRILQKTKGSKVYKYRAGGAIVWDSDVKDEWNEAFVKTSFLWQNTKAWKLIETLNVKNGEPEFFEEHISRMRNSANDLGFEFNPKILNLQFDKDGIYRIELSKAGEIQVVFREYKESKIDKVIISEQIVNSTDVFLKYKTNYRPYYQSSLEKIKQGDIYDEIFFNEKGELTEGSRSNVVLELDGQLYTPSLSCGLLNGIYRQFLLDSGNCIEKVLTKADLYNASKIYCVNSVRGAREVFL